MFRAPSVGQLWTIMQYKEYTVYIECDICNTSLLNPVNSEAIVAQQRDDTVKSR